MADKIRHSIVLVAGTLLGGLGLGVMLLFSGLEIPLIHWTPHPAGSVSSETGAPPAVLRLGPVSSEVATDIAGDLTLGGFSIHERSVVSAGSPSQVIDVGPHSRSTIEGIAERLRRKFPGVPFTIVASR